LLVCCAKGQVLEIESPEPGAHNAVHTYEITDLRTRTHQFKSVKSLLQVRDCIYYLGLTLAVMLCHFVAGKVTPGMMESNGSLIAV